MPARVSSMSPFDLFAAVVVCMAVLLPSGPDCCIGWKSEGIGVLEKRDDSRRPEPRPKVTLLGSAELAECCQRSHLEPSPDLAAYVSVAWTLRWHFDGRTRFVQHVLPDPCVQIVVAPNGAFLQGVVTRAFSATLTGAGFVMGLKFRPGGFFPFARRSVATFTDRRVPLARVFDAADGEQLSGFAAAAEGRGLLDRLESLLRDADPPPDSAKSSRPAPLSSGLRATARFSASTRLRRRLR